MKRFYVILAASAGIALSASVFSAPLDDKSLEVQKFRCFERHAALLDKPSQHTVWKCWEIHGYLMIR